MKRFIGTRAFSSECQKFIREKKQIFDIVSHYFAILQASTRYRSLVGRCFRKIIAGIDVGTNFRMHYCNTNELYAAR